MTCYECQGGRPGPVGLMFSLMFSDWSAVGVCRRCGKGICKAHGVWREETREFLCNACAAESAPQDAEALPASSAAGVSL
jgi:hypothetical protein